MSDAKLSLDMARSDLTKSKSIFNSEVRRPEIGVLDFITNQFIPLLQKLHDSKLFAEEHRKSINRMMSNISQSRDIYKDAKQLGQITRANEKDVELRYAVNEDIIQIEEMLKSLAVPAGNQTTSIAELTEDLPVDETQSLDYDELRGSDGLYSVRKPPEDWIMQEISKEEWVLENVAIEIDPKLKNVQHGTPSERKVLHFKSKRKIIARPIPGKYMLNGRRLPSALEIYMPIQFAVSPLERFEGPLFVERDIGHNTLLYTSSYLSLYELYSIKSGVYRAKKRYMIIELRQILNNVIIEDTQVEEVIHNINLIAFEGEIRDYLITISYPFIHGKFEKELKKDFDVLQSLMESFHPLSFINSEEKRREVQGAADKQFENFMKEYGKQLFDNELGIALVRVSKLSPEDPKELSQILDTLKPFHNVAKELKVNDNKLKELWKVLRDAEQGKTSMLRRVLAESLRTEENIQRQSIRRQY